jgi:predicted TIM-barrel fold metal-dependent hydrolase
MHMTPHPVIDVHAHIGRSVGFDRAQSYEQCVATMDAANIQHAIISPAAAGRQADGVRDSMRQNDAIADAMSADPLRFPLGLAAVEVRHEERALEELERCFNELGLRGVVFHAMFSGFSVREDGVLAPLLDFVNARGGLCLMHAMPDTGPFAMESPREIGKLAERYPGVIFVMGHPAITEDQRAVAIEAALGRDNLYLDLAFQESPATVEVLVRALGAERVLFGSDAPYRDPQTTIRSVEAARLSDDAKEMILYRNALELLRRYSDVL